jgi:sugar phosphate permease
VGFWLIALSFLIGMAFSTVPTPLYPLYAKHDDFSLFVVTVVFAVYALGVIVSLILAGHISDWVGRKRIMIPALGIEALAAVVFIVWPELPGLIVARFVTGLGVGMMTATATAFLHELHSRHRPNAGDGRFEVVSTAANIGGLGVGPLVAGFLAEFIPAPLTVPYLVFLVLLLLAIVAVGATPETVEELPQRPAYRPQALGGVEAGRVFWRAAGAAFSAFAIFGIFTSIAPGFVAGTLDEPSRLLAGVIVFIVFGAAASAQTVTNRLSANGRLALGLAGEATGLIVLVAGMSTANLAAFLIGGAIAGGAAGVLFKTSVGSVIAVTSPQNRGSALAGLFLIAYLGLIIPAVGIGIAVLSLPATTAMVWFAAVLIALLIALAITAVTERRPQA